MLFVLLATCSGFRHDNLMGNHEGGVHATHKKMQTPYFMINRGSIESESEKVI